MNPTSPIATACAASSRYAAPSLRYGPSGDATQPAATGFGMAGSALPAINDRRLTGSARPFTPRLNRHKANRRSSAECAYPNSRVSSAAFIYNNPTTPYSCCQVVQRMGSTSILLSSVGDRKPNPEFSHFEWPRKREAGHQFQLHYPKRLGLRGNGQSGAGSSSRSSGTKSD